MSATQASCAAQRVDLTLRRFPAASPELLAQRRLTTRSDWKFVLPRDRVPALLTALRASHALLFAGDAPIARYDTRYYDGPALKCYQDHRRGKPRRFKLRHRHYGDRSLSMFEIKVRDARGNTEKHRLEVPFVGRGGVLDRTCREFARSRLDVDLEGYAPSLDNSFRRITLLGIRAAERITVDLDLAFSHGDRRAALPWLAVVEVKSAVPRHLAPTLHVLNRAGLRPQGMSKYCAGTCLLRDLPSSWSAGLRRRIASVHTSLASSGAS